MAIEINSNVISAKTQKHGRGVFTAVANEDFEIKLGDNHILNIEVPEGKKWTALSININIDEEDA